MAVSTHYILFSFQTVVTSMMVLATNQILLMLQFVVKDMLSQIWSFKSHIKPGFKVLLLLILFQKFKNMVDHHVERAGILYGRMEHQIQLLSSCNTFKEKQAGRFQN